MTVDILVGAQYGSEGKGVIADYLASKWHYCAAVRVGGPNAGHSFKFKGMTYKMQSLPCAWPYNSTELYIGRGALVNPRVLMNEIHKCEAESHGLARRVHIDQMAGIIEERHEKEEGHTGGEIHQRIGSTGEGIGAARRDRMARIEGQAKFAKDIKELQPYLSENVAAELCHLLTGGGSVLLEGTQGSGLSLIHGQWPYVTSNDTNASQMLADSGLAPGWVGRVILVARTHPIRVAGNSGPLANETTWEKLGRPPEYTTVTNKERRVGLWDWGMFDNALTLNQPDHIALTFMDYLDEENTGATSDEGLTIASREFIRKVERFSGVQVRYVGTGGDKWTVYTRS